MVFVGKQTQIFYLYKLISKKKIGKIIKFINVKLNGAKDNMINEEDKILIYKLYKKIQKEFADIENK